MTGLVGGRTLAVLALLGIHAHRACAQDGPVARVVGTVYDSVALRPLAGAVVRLFRADAPATGRTVVSDTAGRFAYDSVAAGGWVASFLHPALDSLRLDPRVVQLTITEAGIVDVPLSTPSARALVAAACGGSWSADFGVLVGEVRAAADQAPLGDATVLVEWPEWVFVKKRLVAEEMRRIARSDAAGRYTVCGAPAGSTLRVSAWRGADSTGAIEVEVPANGYALQDFLLAAAEYAPLGADSAELGPTPLRLRRGPGMVRGRVLAPTGGPLANAAVRVLGSGTQARTSATGEFTIVDAVPGTQTVEARAIGFQPARAVVQLRASGPVEVALTLAVRSVNLDTVRVVAGRDLPYEVRGIERRWRTGLGTFLDGKTVRNRSTFYTSDALRSIPGVQVRSTAGWGQDVMLRMNGGGGCRAMLFIDGMQMDAAGSGGLTIDDLVTPGEVAVIEVYPRPAMVPAEYLTVGRGCGVVAVWTRQGTQHVPLLPPKSSRR